MRTFSVFFLEFYHHHSLQESHLQNPRKEIISCHQSAVCTNFHFHLKNRSCLSKEYTFRNKQHESQLLRDKVSSTSADYTTLRELTLLILQTEINLLVQTPFWGNVSNAETVFSNLMRCRGAPLCLIAHATLSSRGHRAFSMEKT